MPGGFGPIGDDPLGDIPTSGVVSDSASDTITLDESASRQVIHNRTVSDTLTVDETVSRVAVSNRSVSDTQAVDETISRVQAHIRSISDTITLDELAEGSTAIERTAEDTQAIDEAIARQVIANRTASDTQTVDETVSRQVIHARTINDTLVVDESAIRVRVFQRTVEDTQTVDESATNTRIHVRSVSDTLNCDEGASRAGSVYGRTASDSQSVSETASRSLSATAIADTLIILETTVVNRIHSRTVSDTITTTESAGQVKPKTASDSVTVSETIAASKGRGADDTVVISESVSRAGSIFVRTVEDTIAVDEAVLGGLLSDNCGTAFVPSPALGTRDDVVFTFPYTSPTLQLNVRKPSFGNSKTVDSGAILNKNRSGEPIAYKDSQWPEITVLKMNFSVFNNSIRRKMMDFLDQSAGQEIGFLDHENRQWRGVMLVAEPAMIDGGFGCNNSIDLEFRGELV